MYCTKCGNAVPEGAAFCRTCGNAVAGPVPNLEDAMPPAAAGALEPPVALPPPPIAAPPIGSYIPPRPVVNPALMAPYAGFWLRVVAYLIDSAILTVVFGAIFAICLLTFGGRFLRGFHPGMYSARNVSYDPGYDTTYTWHGPFPFPAAALGVLFILIPLTIVASWLYFALMESSARRGTLGKLVLGLFVTDLQGRRVSFARATGRFFSKIITGLIPFFIGYIMAGFTEKRQALHDMIAGCLVLKKI
jgi:uncharacterized RDD family membrane protein YckC